MLLNKISLIGHKILKKGDQKNTLIVYPDGETMVTDGTMLISASPVPEKEDFPETTGVKAEITENCYIQKKTVEKAIAAIPKNATSSILRNVALCKNPKQDAWLLITTDLETETMIKIPECHGRAFDNWRKKVIDDYEKNLPTAEQPFRLKRVLTVLSVFKDAFGTDVRIKITQGLDRPLIIHAENAEKTQELLGVIMPLIKN